MSKAIGIDIGSKFTKIVLLEKKNRLIILDFDFFPTPFLNLSAGEEKVSFSDLAQKINVFILKNKLNKYYLGINLNPVNISSLVLFLPKMAKKEIRQAAIYEAKRKMVPPPTQTSIFQMQILEEKVFVEGKFKEEVLVVKTEEKDLKEVLDFYKVLSNQPHPPYISPNIFAVLKILSFQKREEKNIALIDLGYQFSTIALLNKFKLYFYRNLKFGIRDVLIYLKANLNINKEEVLNNILEEGVPNVEFDFKDKVKLAEEIMRQKYEEIKEAETKDGINLLELRMHWNTMIERFVHEMRRTFVFYNEQYKERIEKILFFGGGVQIKNLIEIIMQDLGGNYEKINLFSKGYISSLKEEIKQKESFFLSSILLAHNALLGLVDKSLIDFLPYEIKVEEKRYRHKLGLIFFMVLIISGLFLFLINLTFNFLILKKQIKRLSFELAKREKLANFLNQLKEKKANLDIKLVKTQDLINKRINFAYVLAEIANRIPYNLYIEKIFLGETQVTNQNSPSAPLFKIKIDVVYEGDNLEEMTESLENFKNRLEKSNIFKNVNLNTKRIFEKIKILKCEEVKLVPEEKKAFLELELE